MTRRTLWTVSVVSLLSVVGLAHLGVWWWTRPKPNFTAIEDGLYMGGLVREPPQGTRAVLNLCETADPYRAEVHAWEPIPDAEPAPSLDWLRRQVDFVREQRRSGKGVYVHCFNGASRSGMVVTAYLMAENRWTRDEALAFVRSRRSVTRPNPAFMQLLAKWETIVQDREVPVPSSVVPRGRQQ
jgi:protein-tyrosine phosphatase